MVKSTAKSSLILLLFLSVALTATATEGSGFSVGWIPSLVAGRCDGTIGNCLDGAEEGGSGIEAVDRRILSTSKFLGYNALKADTTPCSQLGASYYNCRPDASSNPYSRSCSTITNCRG